MATVIETVAMALSGAGFRTGAASPGGRMPEIEEPVAAVSLEQVDTDGFSLTVRAMVVSPLGMGAVTAENSALTVCRLLRDMGAQCVLEPCAYEEKTELFSVGVCATFYGDVLAGDWVAMPGCSVRLGSMTVSRAVNFEAWRETDSTVTDLHDAVWKFRLEEVMDGAWEEAWPSEPFTVTVTAGITTEQYTGCVVTSQRRILENGRLTQIREGTAAALVTEQA